MKKLNEDIRALAEMENIEPIEVGISSIRALDIVAMTAEKIFENSFNTWDECVALEKLYDEQGVMALDGMTITPVGPVIRLLPDDETAELKILKSHKLPPPEED